MNTLTDIRNAIEARDMSRVLDVALRAAIHHYDALGGLSNDVQARDRAADTLALVLDVEWSEGCKLLADALARRGSMREFQIRGL
jgi:hypothetical protein